jgi:hypothetical protein
MFHNTEILVASSPILKPCQKLEDVLKNTDTHTYAHPLFIGLIALFLSSPDFIFAQSGTPVFRTTPASCHEICDGSVQLELDRRDPAVNYYWKSTADNQYRPLSSNFLLGICPAQYRVRKMTSNQDSLHERTVSGLLEGYEGLCGYSINTFGKREVSVEVSFDRLLNNMNFYVQVRYSHDGGETWRNTAQLHQIPDGKKATSNYVVELPRSFDNKEEVIIEFYKRNSEIEEQVDLRIVEAHFHSKTYEEYSFEIGQKESIHVESTISNETDGKDGYIALKVSKGTPPYSFVWNDKKGKQRVDSLSAGRYISRVTDSKGCSVTSEFLIQAPENSQGEPRFTMSQLDGDKTFRLNVSNIYRQMLELKLTDISGNEVKEFRINPLYEDLDIDLQLSDLPTGRYTATLSTEVFSKNLDLQVK